MTEEERRLRIVLTVRAEVLRAGFTASSCILSTRVLMNVLDYLGIEAKPVAVTVVAFNSKGWELHNAGKPLEDDDAWSVGIEGTGKRRRNATTGRMDWDGHLIALTDDGYVLDPSLDQLSRPAKALTLTPLASKLSAPLRHDNHQGFARNDGTVILYRLLDLPNSSWSNSADWRQKHQEIRTVTATVIRRLKESLKESS